MQSGPEKADDPWLYLTDATVNGEGVGALAMPLSRVEISTLLFGSPNR